MFEDNIEIIKYCFKEFRGTGMYIAIFLISLIYIFVKSDKKKRIFFVYYSLFIFLITLNPFFNKAVGSIFKKSTYWRVFWMLPLGITIAYAGVKLIGESNKKFERIFVSIGLILTIIISGKLIYNKDNYKQLGNVYKLPDEAVLVAQLLKTDEYEGQKKAYVPETLTPYIRQIDGSINLAYKREPAGYKGHKFVETLAIGDVKKITDLAKETECNYIVMKKEVKINVDFHYFGYEKINETDNYIIYKKTS